MIRVYLFKRRHEDNAMLTIKRIGTNIGSNNNNNSYYTRESGMSR